MTGRACVGALLCVLVTTALAMAPTVERVSFDSLAVDAASGRPVRLDALLLRPANQTAATVRRPAVIALHGCGGLYSARQSHRDALSARHRRMAEMLVDEGYLVLFPDSLRSRGIEEICSIRNHLRGLTVTQRRRDAQAALRWLQQRPDVIGDRIALVGWSHGGSTVLATLNQRSPAVASSTQRTGAAPYFHAAAAFYPSCVASTRARSGYALAAPLTMFVGGRDDWTAPEPCVRLAGGLAAAGEPVSLTVYPQAFHGFDGPPSPPRRRLDVPNGVRPGEGVTVAPDAAARDDAYAKLRAFLRQRLVGTQPPDGGANPAI